MTHPIYCPVRVPTNIGLTLNGSPLRSRKVEELDFNTARTTLVYPGEFRKGTESFGKQGAGRDVDEMGPSTIMDFDSVSYLVDIGCGILQRISTYTLPRLRFYSIFNMALQGRHNCLFPGVVW